MGSLCVWYRIAARSWRSSQVDDTVPRGGVVLRDVVGASPSEIVRVIKLDTDTLRTSDPTPCTP